MACDGDYTVLVSPWNRQWDVFVLHPVDGLIGSAVARNFADVEPAARAVLIRKCGNERHRISLTVLQRAASDRRDHSGGYVFPVSSSSS